MSLLLALAAAASPVQPGIWEGTVGTLPVRACFVRREWGTFGSYYYRSRLKTIPLQAMEKTEGSFVEGLENAAPRWTIERVGGGRLSGRWTGGGRTLPIRLRRIAGGGESPCGGAAFHGPRLDGVTTVSSAGAKDGVRYTRLSLSHRDRFDASVETFQLGGASAAARRIDEALRRPLAGDEPEWLQCVAGALEQTSNEGTFHSSLAPAMISGRWLSVVEQHDLFCGGAHPSAGRTYRAFDRTSGAEIDLHDWLTDKAVRREPLGSDGFVAKTLRPAMRDAILAGWRGPDADCNEVVRGEEYWNIGLTREGLIFSPQLAHAMQACGEEFTMPFARMARFLTKPGAENVRELRGR